MTGMPNRKQLNVRVSQDLLDKIDWLRANTKPFPTTTDVVVDAVNEQYERVKKKMAAAEKRA